MKKGEVMIEYFLAKNELRNHCLVSCLKPDEFNNLINENEKKCLNVCSLKMRDYMQTVSKLMDSAK